MKPQAFLMVATMAVAQAMATSAAPTFPAGTWLVPSTHQSPLDIRTSIGVVALRDEHAKDGYPFTEVELNGKRLILGGDGRFDLGRVEIERVLDLGGSIDLVFAQGCGGNASSCHLSRRIAQIDSAGRVRSNIDAQQDCERPSGTQAFDRNEDWAERGGSWAMVLGRKGSQIREVRLSPGGVRLVTRNPINPGELAALKKLEQQP